MKTFSHGAGAREFPDLIVSRVILEARVHNVSRNWENRAERPSPSGGKMQYKCANGRECKAELQSARLVSASA